MKSLPIALAISAVLAGPSFARAAHDDAHEQLAQIVAALEAGGTPGPLFLRRADLERQLGHIEIAKALFERAASEGADPRGIALGVAACATDVRDFAESLRILSAAIENYPRASALRKARARAFSELEFPRAAACDLLICRRLAPRRFSIDDDLRLVQTYLAYSDRPAALRALDRALDRRGPVAVLIVRAIELEAAQHTFDAALARAATLAAAGVAAYEVELIRADILERASRPQEAAKARLAARAAQAARPFRRRVAPIFYPLLAASPQDAPKGQH